MTGSITITPATNGAKKSDFIAASSLTSTTPSRVYGTDTTTVALLGSGIGLCFIAIVTLIILSKLYSLMFPKKRATNTKKTANSELVEKLEDLIKQ